MGLRTKVAATVLSVLTVVGALSASRVSRLSAQGRSSGCPMHRQSVPPHAPVDHSCCQSGHDAVPQKTASPQQDASVSLLINSDQEFIAPDGAAHFHPDTFSFGSPPPILQLRI
jgi:hypothetical protein